MKQTLNVVIEIQKNDSSYSFSMPYGVNIGEAYDAAHLMLQEIVKMGQAAADKAARPQEGDQNGN